MRVVKFHDNPFKNGDIVNIDVTVFHRGYHGDLNETLFVGTPSEKAEKLVRNTHECLQKAIDESVKPGIKVTKKSEPVLAVQWSRF